MAQQIRCKNGTKTTRLNDRNCEKPNVYCVMFSLPVTKYGVIKASRRVRVTNLFNLRPRRDCGHFRAEERALCVVEEEAALAQERV
jgi:hypothetical protein